MSERGIFYGRVSDRDQVHGASLDQQEQSAREWFGRQGVEAVRLFRELGESARTRHRTTLRAALEFVRAQRFAGTPITVFLVYDLSRFCRNLEDQLALKRELAGFGCRLDSITLQLVESPEGRFAQNAIGASNQLVSELQGKKIRECMLHRKQAGRWPHRAPLGYVNRRAEDGSRKWIEPDPARAPLLREAFAAIARGERPKVVLDRAAALGFVSQRGLPLRMQEFRKLLANPIYAGRVRSPRWGVDVAGEHQALVDAGTFARVQERLAGRGGYRVAVKRQRDRTEFPLRGFARCASCGRPLTASSSRGKMGGRYGYYACWHPACGEVRVRDTELERRFVGALDRLRLAPGELALAEEILLEVSRQVDGEGTTTRAAAGRRLLELHKRRERMVEAFVYEQAIDRATYDAHLQRLDGEIHSVNLELAHMSEDSILPERLIELARPLFYATSELWQRSDLDAKRRLQTLVFPEGVKVSKTALGTPVTAEIYSVLGGLEMEKVKMVEQQRASWNSLAAWIHTAVRTVILPQEQLAAAWGVA